MTKKKKKKEELDEFHYHEAMDRTSMFCSMLDNELLGHPVFEQDEEMHKELEHIIDNLYKLYCNVGQMVIQKFTQPEK